MFGSTFTLLQCLSFFVNCVFVGCQTPAETNTTDEDPSLTGVPLFLTPYIRAGKIREAQAAAEVHLEGTNVTSYSGYLTIDSAFDSNLFFWFFPARSDAKTAPVMVWLQGGPGVSSLFGLFLENGPFAIGGNNSLNHREFSWTKFFSMLYIDNPVGTGFSFTGNDEGYSMDEESVGKNLYFAILQFFELFPHLRSNDLFVAGESYAGKYIPALGYTILTNNENSFEQINLKGLIIGNGFVDPENMMVYSDYFYQLGLVDYGVRERAKEMEEEIIENIKNEAYQQAYVNFAMLMYRLITEAGKVDYYNYVRIRDDNFSYFDGLVAYIESEGVRGSIHVGNKKFNVNEIVKELMINDTMATVRPWLEELLEHYRVLFYSGQMDLMVPYPMTVNYLRKLNWSGAESYKNATRQKWMSGKEFAGYYKTADKITEVLVRNAGHMVTIDQPRWLLDLVSKFVFNNTF